MDPQRKALLEARGWKVGSVDEFLGLTSEEIASIELRLKLANSVSEVKLGAKA